MELLARAGAIADQSVEQGGVGAGTIINFQMRLMGRLQTFRSAITEPEPGRVLAETDLNTGPVTTFTVEPREGGRQAYVTITTTTKVCDGILGSVEGWLTTQLLHPIYVKELAQLAAVARNGRCKLSALGSIPFSLAVASGLVPAALGAPPTRG